MLLLVGLGAIFLGIVLLLAVVGALSTQRSGVGRSLAAVEAMSSAPESMRQELDRPFSDRVVSPGFSRLTDLGRRFTPVGQANRIRHKLDLAGNPAGWDVDRVLAFKMIGLIVGLVLGFAIPLLFGWSALVLIGVVIVLAALGFMTPNLVLYQAAYERSERLRKDLPDALDLLTISVEAGLSFNAAMSEVARKTTGPLASEFFRVLQEMQIGVDRADAIRAMGERTDLPELRQFATAMVQADSFGIPIANVLRVQASEMRVKRSQRAEEQAQKVPVKVLFPLIFCILPALFVIILGPAAITIVENIFEATP
jgi:tight adherence protein C